MSWRWIPFTASVFSLVAASFAVSLVLLIMFHAVGIRVADLVVRTFLLADADSEQGAVQQILSRIGPLGIGSMTLSHITLVAVVLLVVELTDRIDLVLRSFNEDLSRRVLGVPLSTISKANGGESVAKEAASREAALAVAGLYSLRRNA